MGVIACAVATPAGVKQNAKKKLYEETSKDAPTEVIREDDTDSVSIRAEAKCGIGHGRCPTNQCCSLANTCGRTAPTAMFRWDAEGSSEAVTKSKRYLLML